VAVSLGNCFIWVSSQLEDGPHIEQPLSENASSVFALGKQFRLVGLKFWDQKLEPFQPGTEIALLRAEVARLDRLVHRSLAQRRGK